MAEKLGGATAQAFEPQVEEGKSVLNQLAERLDGTGLWAHPHSLDSRHDPRSRGIPMDAWGRAALDEALAENVPAGGSFTDLLGRWLQHLEESTPHRELLEKLAKTNLDAPFTEGGLRALEEMVSGQGREGLRWMAQELGPDGERGALAEVVEGLSPTPWSPVRAPAIIGSPLEIEDAPDWDKEAEEDSVLDPDAQSDIPLTQEGAPPDMPPLPPGAGETDVVTQLDESIVPPAPPMVDEQDGPLADNPDVELGQLLQTHEVQPEVVSSDQLYADAGSVDSGQQPDHAWDAGTDAMDAPVDHAHGPAI